MILSYRPITHGAIVSWLRAFDCGIPEKVLDAIVGHAPASVGRGIHHVHGIERRSHWLSAQFRHA